jgi:HTH-type transcriptional regulator/antitoxin HipB
MQYPVHTAQQLATALRSRRTQMEMTQRDAGQAVGLLAKTVSGLETDPERASVRSLLRLLSALELELVLRPKESGGSDETLEW